jgi:hypothetical protein
MMRAAIHSPTVCLRWIVIGFLPWVSMTTAAEVSFVGIQSGGGAGGWVVENWSNTAVPKDFDLDGDHRYGTAGSVQIRPQPWNGPGDAFVLHEPAAGPWSDGRFGAGISPIPSNVLKPVFTTNLLGMGGDGYSYVNFDGYSVFTGPSGGGQYRQGAISVPVVNPAANVHGSGNWGNAVYFDLNQQATFRVGIVVDANGLSAGYQGEAIYSPDYISLYDSATGTTTVSPRLTRDGVPDMVFFDISGGPGVQFAIALWQSTNPGEPAPSGIAGFSMVTFDRAPGEGAPPPYEPEGSQIGRFLREGEYLKDYYIYQDGGTFHLFYNVGTADDTQAWWQPGNEKAFGHATSTDLINWQHHPRVLPVIPDSWEGAVVSAPSILRHNGLYYMIYTGFDDRVPGRQAVGLATSTDLFDWQRHPANPVYTAPPWTLTQPGGWVDCRDSHIIRHGDEFLLFTTVTTQQGQGAIALASSEDAVNWLDHGPAVVTFDQPESPRVFEHGGKFYLFVSSGYGRELYVSADPKSNSWTEIPFTWPEPGLWSGWEVLQFNGRTIFSAFEWRSHGNEIRFWDVEWNGDLPSISHTGAPPPATEVPALRFSKSGSHLFMHWPLEVSGWTLESSRSLAPGSWAPVPGVMSNSVTAPIDGPRNFFRLGKD